MYYLCDCVSIYFVCSVFVLSITLCVYFIQSWVLTHYSNVSNDPIWQVSKHWKKKKEFCLTTLCLDPVTIDFLSRSKCTSFHVLRNNMYYLFMQLVGNLVLGDHCVLVIVGKKKLFLRWFYVSFPFFDYLYSVINILVKTATKLTFKLL